MILYPKFRLSRVGVPATFGGLRRTSYVNRENLLRMIALKERLPDGSSYPRTTCALSPRCQLYLRQATKQHDRGRSNQATSWLAGWLLVPANYSFAALAGNSGGAARFHFRVA